MEKDTGSFEDIARNKLAQAIDDLESADIYWEQINIELQIIEHIMQYFMQLMQYYLWNQLRSKSTRM